MRRTSYEPPSGQRVKVDVPAAYAAPSPQQQAQEAAERHWAAVERLAAAVERLAEAVEARPPNG